MAWARAQRHISALALGRAAEWSKRQAIFGVLTVEAAGCWGLSPSVSGDRARWYSSASLGPAPIGDEDMHHDKGYRNRIELTNEIHKHRTVALRAPLSGTHLAVVKESSNAASLIDSRNAGPKDGGRQAPHRAAGCFAHIGESRVMSSAPSERAGPEYVHMCALCELYGVQPPPPHHKHFSAALGPMKFIYEEHEEFCTFTFYREPSADESEEPITSWEALQSPPIADERRAIVI
eukprot:jgi/Tetstr1/455216/TSEL_042064.t1